MGKKIDLFVLSTAVTAALYLFFRGAFPSRGLAVALAALSSLVFHRGARRLRRRLLETGWAQKRRMRRHSGGAIMRLACMEDIKARSELERLLRLCYDGEYELRVLQLHPGSALPEARLFDLWRESRDKERLVIVATCKADAAARALCAGLKGPSVALIDSEQLSALIAEHPEGLVPPDAPAPRRLRLNRLAALLLNRKNAPRNLALALCLMLIYLLTNRLSYLISSLALVALALFSLRRARRPAKLF